MKRVNNSNTIDDESEKSSWMQSISTTITLPLVYTYSHLSCYLNTADHSVSHDIYSDGSVASTGVWLSEMPRTRYG